MCKGFKPYSLAVLKQVIDSAVEDASVDSNDIPVLIDLSEPSIGARASATVKYAGMGFDWEAGQFRISPSQPLVGKGRTLDDPKPAIVEAVGNRNCYWCSQCGNKVSKDDRYCRSCGQKLL